MNTRGEDRRFIHSVGANAEFTGQEMTAERIGSCRSLYVGGFCLFDTFLAENVAAIRFEPLPEISTPIRCGDGSGSRPVGRSVIIATSEEVSGEMEAHSHEAGESHQTEVDERAPPVPGCRLRDAQHQENDCGHSE